jgi:EAL domain-containing protein (putative c-di-GMP-specific phosphodiesterase class I)
MERIRLEGMLRQTLERGELVLYYQPEVDIATKKTACVEALVRWNHPEKGLLLPDQFIPLAEETGFINALDAWAIRTACLQAKAWQNGEREPLCVTVNLASRCLRSPDELKLLSQILKETGIDPRNLDIEITESTAMTDIERTAPVLKKMAEMGIRISIDDFGTGYSSLNHLKKLPIKKIKIDRSFIKDIATDADDRAIIGAVTSMAHKMGIRAVAEGVETEEQLEFVREAGCDEAQGYLFSRPLTARQFEEFIFSEK